MKQTDKGESLMGLHAHRALAPELKEVDIALRSWADWALSSRVHIGWPRVSMTGRMVEWHRIGIRPERMAPLPVHIPDQVARVDALVAKLPDQQRLVLMTHYMRDEPIEVKIRATRMRAGTYRRYLDFGRWSLRLGLLVK